MSQHECSNLYQSYLELQNSYDGHSYIVQRLVKSSTTLVYNIFPDSEVNLAEIRKIPDLSKFWNSTETSMFKFHISGSTYPNKFQLILLESLEKFLQRFYRILFQIL